MPEESRPAIVAVDDEPAVLAAVARDLRRGFGERYRILRAGSGAEALELLREVRARGDQVALLIADQRMPGMAGTEYLVEARDARPRRQARAADRLRRHRGGDRRDQRGRARLLPAQAVGPARGAAVPGRRGPARRRGRPGAALESGGVRVIGHRFSKESHELRDFLARNRVPARWLDVERDAEARELLEVAGVDADRLPVALLEDGIGARAADGARARRAPRRHRPARPGALRPGHRRRRPGRAGRGGLRRLRGPAHGDGRARGAGRAGGPVEPDRELPRLPGRRSAAPTSRGARPTRRGGSAPSC